MTVVGPIMIGLSWDAVDTPIDTPLISPVSWSRCWDELAHLAIDWLFCIYTVLDRRVERGIRTTSDILDRILYYYGVVLWRTWLWAFGRRTITWPLPSLGQTAEGWWIFRGISRTLWPNWSISTSFERSRTKLTCMLGELSSTVYSFF